VSVIIPLWSGYGGGGSSGSAGSGGRAGRRAGFAGRDGVGGAGTCARRGTWVGGRRLGGGGDSGRRGECNGRLGLVILHQCRGGQGLGVGGGATAGQHRLGWTEGCAGSGCGAGWAEVWRGGW
jgi:hypothetical protein